MLKALANTRCNTSLSVPVNTVALARCSESISTLKTVFNGLSKARKTVEMALRYLTDQSALLFKTCTARRAPKSDRGSERSVDPGVGSAGIRSLKGCQKNSATRSGSRIYGQTIGRKGDLARFVVFRKLDRTGDWKSAIPSVPFAMEDDVIREGNDSFRLKH